MVIDSMGTGGLVTSLHRGRGVQLALGTFTACRIRCLVTAIVCVLIAGCGGEARLGPVPETSPVPGLGTPVAFSPAERDPSRPPSIGEIVWATSADPESNAPVDTVATFSPDAARITAYMLTDAIPAGSTIEATWEYNSTSLDALTRQVVPPSAIGESWISFHLERGQDTRWPTGVYEISVSLDGSVVRRAAVEIVNPA